MSKEFQCPVHGSVQRGPCSECVAAFENRRHPSEMTNDERADELERMGRSTVTIPFSDLHQRISELVGRPVYPHEMGSSGWPLLIEEARTNDHPSWQEIKAKLPEHMGIIEVDVSEAAS